MNTNLCFEDILLEPRYSNIRSRKDISLKNKLDDNIELTLPIISSPMDTITESKMAVAVEDAGGLGIILI